MKAPYVILVVTLHIVRMERIALMAAGLCGDGERWRHSA